MRTRPKAATGAGVTRRDLFRYAATAGAVCRMPRLAPALAGTGPGGRASATGQTNTLPTGGVPACVATGRSSAPASPRPASTPTGRASRR